MNNRRLILVAAGGFGRELMAWAGDCHQHGMAPMLSGFIDDYPDVLKKYHYSLPYLGPIETWQPDPHDLFLLGFGNPDDKFKAARLLLERGANFMSLIHPTAIVAQSASLGTGVILCPHAVVSADAQLGDFVTLNVFSTCAHDVKVGAFSTVSAHVDLMGFAQVGEHAFLGSGARVLPNVKIGNRARIGAGATIVRNVPDDTTMFTPSAKVL